MDPITLTILGGSAALGGIGGYLSNESAKDALDKQLEYFKSLSPKLQAQYADRIKQIEDARLQVENSAGGEDAVRSYYDMLKGYDPTKYIYEPTDFEYTKTEKDFMDPAADYRNRQAIKATEQSLAGQGNLFSGGAGRQLAAEASDRASTEWSASNERMTKDKQTAYQQYRDKVADIKDKLSGQRTGYMNKLKLAEIPKTDVYSARETATGRKLTALEQQQQNELDIGNTVAGIQSQRDKIGGWQGALSSIIAGGTGGASTGANIYSAINK